MEIIAKLDIILQHNGLVQLSNEKNCSSVNQ